jgi:hypothetical protein
VQGNAVPAGVAPAGWFDLPMRWVQLALVENDPGHFDPQFWLDYFKRLHADAATLSAGGIVAYYPTKVPLHHRSDWLGDSDPFGMLVSGCRKLGMRVLARTDPHAARDDVRQAHPDWISVDPTGAPRRHWANPDLWITCALGPYNFELMDRVHREIVETYKVDGIFSNRWKPQGGDCFCTHCAENFRAATGHELPTTTDVRDPRRREYVDWRNARLVELWKQWDATSRATPRRDSFPTARRRSRGRQLAEIQFSDFQARHGLIAAVGERPPRQGIPLGDGTRPIAGIFSVGVEERYRWKDSVQSEPESPSLGRRGHGERPAAVGGEVLGRALRPSLAHDGRARSYGWHFAHERYLRNDTPLRAVSRSSIPSRQPRLPGQSRATPTTSEHVLGMYHALVEPVSRSSWCTKRSSIPDRLAPFKLLICPDAAALSDAQCDVDPKVSSQPVAASWRPSRRRSAMKPASAARISRLAIFLASVHRSSRWPDAELVSQPRR